MKLKNKKNRNIIGIIQSCLIFALVILVIFMMIQINRLQGTARVINYAGLVRGATQREVKLEITGSQNDELIKYLDDILSGLKYQDGNYDLVKLQDKEYQDKLQVQIVFDLNNLKFINDTMGHSAGDRLIVKFAGLLRSVFPEKDFVGRYGGDEFMAVIYDTDKAEVDKILKCLCLEKDKLNNTGNELQIDYACGWAISEDYKESTLQILFDSADSYMYENKQLCKKQNH